MPENEAGRVEALRSYGILDTPADPAYDAFARLAADICDAPIAFVSLVDSERQWFKANVGMPEARETSRDVAFCAHAIETPDRLLEIPDTTIDLRFNDNPHVIGEPNIRFYAGAPLVDSLGNALGTLCALDRRPRMLSDEQREGLRRLADGVAGLIEARKGLESERLEQIALLASALERIPEPIIIARTIARGRPPNFAYVNRAFTERFGYTLADVVMKPLQLLTGANTDRSRIARLAAAIESGEAGSEVVSLYTKNGAELTIDIRDRVINATHRIVSFHDLTRVTAMQAALARSNDRLASFLRYNADAVLTLDRTGACIDANAAAVALFGAHADLGTFGFRDVPFPQPLQNGRPDSYAATHARGDGSVIHLECTAVPIVVGGLAEGAYIIAKDVSERVTLGRRVAQQAERTRALYLISAMRGASENEQIEAALRLAVESLGMAAAFVGEVQLGELVIQHVVGDGIPPVGATFALEDTFAAEVFRSGDVLMIDDLAAIAEERPANTTAQNWHAYVAAPLPAPTGHRAVVGLLGSEVGAFGDVDREFARLLASLLGTLLERQDQKHRLARLAYHDHLTGLPNRAKFTATLGDAVARASEMQTAFAIHCVDLDGFKQLNDRAGHHVGDLALQEVARRLERITRRCDIAARLGGDEFIVLQADVASVVDADALAWRIVDLLSKPYVLDGDEWLLGASVGVANFPADARDAQSLLQSADAALYRAKECGKGRVAHARDAEFAS